MRAPTCIGVAGVALPSVVHKAAPAALQLLSLVQDALLQAVYVVHERVKVRFYGW